MAIMTEVTTRGMVDIKAIYKEIAEVFNHVPEVKAESLAHSASIRWAGDTEELIKVSLTTRVPEQLWVTVKTRDSCVWMYGDSMIIEWAKGKVIKIQVFDAGVGDGMFGELHGAMEIRKEQQ